MTPAARHATAAALLDAIGGGAPAEQALTNWGRKNRFAGSGDRAAIRDIVFDVLRRRRSCAVRGGGTSGRALVLGFLRERGVDPATVFTGARHALAPLSAEEAASGAEPGGLDALDLPDWIAPRLEASLGAAFEPVALALRERAPLFLRWHAGRTDADEARARLAAEGIESVPHPLAATALEVTAGGRRLRQSAAYREGLVEIQDAASQAVCAALPAGAGRRVLDYCAGGGGKGLALAARGAEVIAHDADPARMADLPARAARAGTPIRRVSGTALAALGQVDLVLADVPCSGSGAWRRQAEAKWRLSEAALSRLVALQAEILAAAACHVRPGGALAYVTCSLLEEENAAQVGRFRAEAGAAFDLCAQHCFTPLDGGDGFFLALMRRNGRP